MEHLSEYLGVLHTPLLLPEVVHVLLSADLVLWMLKVVLLMVMREGSAAQEPQILNLG